jgi:hypothetical protein
VRTCSEIINRIELLKDSDFFGFDVAFLARYLPVELALPYIESATEDDGWVQTPNDRTSLISEMLHYMPFAWGKAKDFRGLSARRSMSHYMTWLWLLGDDISIFDNYEYYGKDILCKICERYGWDAKQWDDGVRLNSEPYEQVTT